MSLESWLAAVPRPKAERKSCRFSEPQVIPELAPTGAGDEWLGPFSPAAWTWDSHWCVWSVIWIFMYFFKKYLKHKNFQIILVRTQVVCLENAVSNKTVKEKHRRVREAWWAEREVELTTNSSADPCGALNLGWPFRASQNRNKRVGLLSLWRGEPLDMGYLRGGE